MGDEVLAVREEAARAVRHLGGTRRAIQALGKQLAESEESGREKAVLALEQLKSQEAAPVLLDVLGDSRQSSSVVCAAIRVLEGMEWTTASPLLLDRLKRHAEHPAVRTSAARALGKLRPQGALEALLQAAAVPDSELQDAVLEALGQFPEAAVADLGVLLRVLAGGKDNDTSVSEMAGKALRARAQRALKGLSWPGGESTEERAVEGLLEALRRCEGEIRQRIACALGWPFGHGVLELLRELHLGPPESPPGERTEGDVVSLFQRNETADAETLRQGLRSGNRQQSQAAAREIQRRLEQALASAARQEGEPPPVPEILAVWFEALRHEEPTVRNAAFLRPREKDTAVPVLPRAVPWRQHLIQGLCDTLREEEADVWVGVIHALRRLTATEAIPVLIRCLRQGPTEDVRAEAATALGDLFSQAGAEQPEIVHVLKEALTQGPPAVRAQTGRALAMIRNDEAEKALLLSLKDSAPEVRASAVAGLGSFGNVWVRAMSIPDEEVRRRVVAELLWPDPHAN
jgi:HEAT repeat protein